MLALYFCWYNLVRKHGTMKMTPAIANDVADHKWTMEELLAVSGSGLLGDYAMTKGQPEDRYRTLQQIKSPEPYSKDRRSWLRHEAGSQAALMDYMLLEGKYSIDDIADRIEAEYPDDDRTRKSCIARILNHFDHLQDAKKGQIPHGLYLKEKTGIWMFDADKIANS